MELNLIWFILIAVFWTGYLVLEGFDFGVGMLLKPLARDSTERRVMINTIGPVWDGNEVWLIVAVGSMFAAFPDWYATMFSGFYLPTLAILLSLIIRGVAFEYRHKRDDARWQRNWERCIMIGSAVPAVLWGLIFANLVQGVPVGSDKNFTGDLTSLISPYTVLGGLVMAAIFLTHGAIFIALKTLGTLRIRARRYAVGIGAVALVGAVLFIVWTTVAYAKTPGTPLLGLLAVILLAASLAAVHSGREGWSFAGSAVCIAALTVMIFVTLFPNVVVSSLNPAWNLTIENAAATDYALGVMTVAGLVFTPIVIAYQAWTYWVFRRRIGTAQMPRSH